MGGRTRGQTFTIYDTYCVHIIVGGPTGLSVCSIRGVCVIKLGTIQTQVDKIYFGW